MNIARSSDLSVFYRPSNNLVFVGAGSKEIGRLSWDEGELKFTGDANESARLFFEHVLKPQLDQYIKTRLRDNKT